MDAPAFGSLDARNWEECCGGRGCLRALLVFRGNHAHTGWGARAAANATVGRRPWCEGGGERVVLAVQVILVAAATAAADRVLFSEELRPTSPVHTGPQSPPASARPDRQRCPLQAESLGGGRPMTLRPPLTLPFFANLSCLRLAPSFAAPPPPQHHSPSLQHLSHHTAIDITAQRPPLFACLARAGDDDGRPTAG